MKLPVALIPRVFPLMKLTYLDNRQNFRQNEPTCDQMTVSLQMNGCVWLFSDPYKINAFGILKIRNKGALQITPCDKITASIGLQSRVALQANTGNGTADIVFIVAIDMFLLIICVMREETMDKYIL